ADRITATSFLAKLVNIETAYVKSANIGVAQIDTLRLAAGSVVAGTSTGFSQWVGASGDPMVGIGNVGVYLPYGGTLICFLQAAVSGSVGGPTPSRIVASINGNPIILDVTSSTSGTMVESFTYIYGPVGAGTYTMWVDGQRPNDGGRTYA